MPILTSRVRPLIYLRGLLLVTLLMPLVGAAASLVLEETARIEPPGPEYAFPFDFAIDGDWLLAGAVRYVPTSPTSEENSAWLYQRQANGSWAPRGRLHTFLFESDGDEPSIQIAMQGGVAVVMKENLSWIFERSGTTWTNVPSPIQTDGMDVAINNGAIVVTSGRCSWSTNAYRKGSNGAWALVRQTPAEPDPDYICENEDINGDTDVAANGSTTIVASYGASGSARIFEGAFGTTAMMTRLMSPDPSLRVGYDVAVENTSAIVSGGPWPGIHSYSRPSVGNWTYSGPVQRPDALNLDGPLAFDMGGPLALVTEPSDPLYGERTGSVSVFERDDDGSYRYAARLMASDREPFQYFGALAEISGRRVAALNGATRSIHIYELPSSLAAPATRQDNFEDGNASDWTPVAGSSFSVVTAGGSRVYRQSSTVSNAASLWSNSSRSNQAIEADIRPTAFASSAGDKWFGLLARYRDASNYYYVTIRNNNTVLLRRMVNGTFTTLASATLPVTLNRNYRVRLEAIGTHLRVFVDNQLLASATDRTLTQGLAGVMMYKMQADYDNVLVSVNPRTTLVTQEFSSSDDSLWRWEQTGPWSLENGAYTQRDTTSGARAITGVNTEDQIVHSRMRRIGAAGTNNWFGLATRYRDEGNYYYVTLRNNNTISLRKLVNGAIVELDSAQLTIAANTWYRVRFDAIGTQLRVYINDVLRLEASDASHATGRYGPVMYRTAAQYDNLLAIEP